MKLPLLITILLFATVLLAGHSANAFTVDKNSDTNGNGSVKFSDPDDQLDNMTDGSSSSHPGMMQFDGSYGAHSYFGAQPNNYSEHSTHSALQ